MARKFPRLVRIHVSLTVFFATEPPRRRVPLTLTPRLTAMVLVPFDGCVLVGLFWNGELVLLLDGAAGQA